MRYYREMFLEKTKQGVIMLTMRMVCVLDVKKMVYELSGAVVKFGTSQTDNDSSNPP